MVNDISWMFLNCDEWVSTKSMNPVYNAVVYRKRAGRRALWRKIKAELKNEIIIIEDRDMPKVRKAILEGDPLEANEYMTYGFILALEEAV